MDFTGLCQKMVILFFCMAAGFVAAKAKVMDVQSNKKLSSLVVNVSNPMQIFASALTGEHVLSNRQTLGLTGIILAIYASLIVLSFAVPKLLRVPKEQKGVYRFMFIFANTGFLGYPIVESLLGYQATFYVTLYVLFFQILCWSRGSIFTGGCCGSRASLRRWRHLPFICPAGSRRCSCTGRSSMSATSQAPSSC